MCLDTELANICYEGLLEMLKMQENLKIKSEKGKRPKSYKSGNKRIVVYIRTTGTPSVVSTMYYLCQSC
jgi:archaellum component FlaG (FlaF/FlaG flagellin family)